MQPHYSVDMVIKQPEDIYIQKFLILSFEIF